MKGGLQAPRAGLGGQHGLPARFGGFGSQHSASTLSYLAEPPSLTLISNPHVVVMLKNVLKKDSTTKGRALEELLGHVQQASEAVEDALLDVWVQIYPRIAIDNSRRVRELSHNLQLELLKSGRKRMERRLSGIVASWIAGSFDRDRAVARVANAGLASFLDTQEKLKAFWLKCQPQILDFAIEAIHETHDTLSDERTTTREDADSKYFRVMYAGLCLGLGLLQRVPDDSLSAYQSRYGDLLGDITIWKLIEANDSSVRKVVCHLMFACLDRGLSYVDTKQIRLAFVTGGLRTSQAGTALEYVRTLTKLTEAHPHVWIDGQGKKSPLARLCAFISKGSQGSPPKFWEQLDSLLRTLPGNPDNPVALAHARELISAVQSGIRHREEPRTNTSFAWKCYIDTATRLLAQLPSADQLAFASETFLPLFEKFLFSPPGNDVAIPLGPNAMSIFVEAHNALARGSSELRSTLVKEWKSLAEKLCTNIAGVLPEVSKDFAVSQENLGEEGRRWFGLVGEIHGAEGAEADTASIVVEPSGKVISQCLQLLQSRNLKPYGAARVLEFALSSSSYLFEGSLGRHCVEFMSSAPNNDMQRLINSPSASSLISSLGLLRSIPPQQADALEVWGVWVKLILDVPASETRTRAIASMISSNDISKLVQESIALQDEISSQTVQYGAGVSNACEFLDVAVQYDAMSPNTVRNVVLKLTNLLDANRADTTSTLTVLVKLIRYRPNVFTEDESLHTALIRHLISLEETRKSELSSIAVEIRSLLGGGPNNASVSIVAIIQQNLDSAGPQSLNIETLAQQAQDAINGGASEDDIFPNTNMFIESLLPFLEQGPDPSMAIMNSIGETTFLVTSPEDRSSARPPPRDSEGRSIPARMALYMCHILNNGQKMSVLPTKFQVELLYLQALVVQLVSDQISLGGQNGVWLSLDAAKAAKAAEEAEWLVSTSKRQLLCLVESCTDWSASQDKQANIMPQLIKFLAQQSMALTPTAMHSSRVLGEIFQSVAEKNGIPAAWEEEFLTPTVLKASPDRVLLAAAVLCGMGTALRPFKSINTLCNRLVSDITAVKASTEKATIILSLIVLCGSVYEAGVLPIPSNRLVFAVKHITGWFEEGPELSPEFASACLRSLGKLLPCIKDVYGSVWEKTLQYCIKSWERARESPSSSELPLRHAALKLARVLQDMDDINDDLEEALAVFSKQKGPALIELLRLDRDIQTQPQEIVDRLLCREVETLSRGQLPEPEELYGLIASESEVIQTAAFTLLHRIIPEQQEQRAVDVLLDKSDARLPDELLSLLLDAPTLEQFSDDVLAIFPLSVRGYLLSWKLIFDAYAASPFKIRADFTEGLETDNPVTSLLDFMFDVLGHSAGYPLKLDKEQITREHIKAFDIKLADAEPGEKSMHWLLSHLYYLTLKYLPGLFRRWFQDCRSKQTKMAVESWTESFFSPLVIEEALDDVQTWANATNSSASGEAELAIKVSKGCKEVFVQYEIDESQGGISIKLPNNFPLDGVTVRGIRRVAVDDRKWQSWIMTTQGVITFSHGNIIDGIQAFRRNLTGALQGHTECAICYSVISSDQRVPEKNCTTCKNLFHRLCLYKWFQTSNNNTCPLCRTPIDFAGASGLKRRNG